MPIRESGREKSSAFRRFGKPPHEEPRDYDDHEKGKWKFALTRCSYVGLGSPVPWRGTFAR